MKLEIDENTKVRCTSHLDHELQASFAIDKNILLISRCEHCENETSEEAERAMRNDQLRLSILFKSGLQVKLHGNDRLDLEEVAASLMNVKLVLISNERTGEVISRRESK